MSGGLGTDEACGVGHARGVGLDGARLVVGCAVCLPTDGVNLCSMNRIDSSAVRQLKVLFGAVSDQREAAHVAARGFADAHTVVPLTFYLAGCKGSVRDMVQRCDDFTDDALQVRACVECACVVCACPDSSVAGKDVCVRPRRGGSRTIKLPHSPAKSKALHA